MGTEIRALAIFRMVLDGLDGSDESEVGAQAAGWQLGLAWLCFASAVKEWRRFEATLHTAPDSF